MNIQEEQQFEVLGQDKYKSNIMAEDSQFKSQIVDDKQIKESVTEGDSRLLYNEYLKQWKQRQQKCILMKESTMHRAPSSDRYDIFVKYPTHIVRYLKAKFVLEEIIQPIIDCAFFDFNEIGKLELMYLMCFRAWVDIHSSLNLLEQKAIKQSQNVDVEQIEFAEEDKNLQLLVSPVLKVTQKVNKYFYKYHRLLTIKENGWKNRFRAIKDYFFNWNHKQQRDVILAGFEGLDFTRKEQIMFTNEKYLTKEEFKNNSNLERKFKIYAELMLAQFPNLQGFDDFYAHKNQMIQAVSKEIQKKSEKDK